MFFIAHTGKGSDSRLELSSTERPIPRCGEVLIEVAAAGVSRPDILQRKGAYPPPADASPILGLEVSGHVVEIGDGVSRNLLGKPVCALTNGGGYAQYVAVPAPQSLPIPDHVSLEEAASLPETFFTVWSTLFMKAKLNSGEFVLVHGGASGIGSTAIQLANAFGARVLTTAGSDDKVRFCNRLNVEKAWNYHNVDFVHEVLLYTNGRGVDVILDIIGGDYLDKNMQAAAVDGRIVQIGLMGGIKTQINMMPLLTKRLTLMGATLRSQSNEQKGKIAQELLQLVWPLFSSKKVIPLVYQYFPFTEANEAHRLLEENAVTGKVVLTTVYNDVRCLP
ncbi:MAG: NAD(P)H-quinone oxidoreductase [Hahellaceae bacterium]|nr:NAD(P)H-quinone oxidoreductase [Hahellaceae bacterium]